MPVTATISGGRIAGRSACNQYSAACLVAGARIEISHATSTRMACPEPEMELEQAFLANLDRAASFIRVDDVLTFLDEEGRPVLVFGAGPAPAEAG
jgi:heat shock protein HslJ